MKPEKIQQNSALIPDASQKTSVIHKKDEQIRRTYFAPQLSKNFEVAEEYSPEKDTENKSIIDSEDSIVTTDKCKDENINVDNNLKDNVSITTRTFKQFLLENNTF